MIEMVRGWWLGAFAVVACTTAHEEVSSLDSPCVWFAGQWSWSGCGETVCIFYEDHCQVHYDCSSPTNALIGAGSIVGNSLTFGGGVCSATIMGKTLAGGCTAPKSCSFTATHR